MSGWGAVSPNVDMSDTDDEANDDGIPDLVTESDDDSEDFISLVGGLGVDEGRDTIDLTENVPRLQSATLTTVMDRPSGRLPPRLEHVGTRLISARDSRVRTEVARLLRSGRSVSLNSPMPWTLPFQP